VQLLKPAARLQQQFHRQHGTASKPSGNERGSEEGAREGGSEEGAREGGARDGGGEGGSEEGAKEGGRERETEGGYSRQKPRRHLKIIV
jgi:hypothetical protein